MALKQINYLKQLRVLTADIFDQDRADFAFAHRSGRKILPHLQGELAKLGDKL